MPVANPAAIHTSGGRPIEVEIGPWDVRLQGGEGYTFAATSS